MPKRKRTITVSADEEIKIEAVQQEPEQSKAAKAVSNVVASIVGCGHVNKQSFNASNELEDLYCTLGKGHTGDHSAELDGKQVFWNDAAGTPARKHA